MVIKFLNKIVKETMIKITRQILTSNEPIDIDREEKEWIIFRDFLKTKNGCHIMELISSSKKVRNIKGEIWTKKHCKL